MPNIHEATVVSHEPQLQITFLRGQVFANIVQGTMGGYKFEAAIIRQPSPYPAWEFAKGTLRFVELRREADNRVIFRWDHGREVVRYEKPMEKLVDSLTRGLAKHADQIEAARKEAFADNRNSPRLDLSRESFNQARTKWERALDSFVHAEKARPNARENGIQPPVQKPSL